MEASFDQVLKSALIQQHQQVDGQLYRFNYVGKPTVTAQSEEYAFLIKALLDIKQVCLRFENL